MKDPREITLVLVEADDLDMHSDPGPTPWTAQCRLCGGDILSSVTADGLVYESECYCSVCGAVDSWCLDGDRAYLAHRPDDGPTIDVVRSVFYTAAARAVWLARTITDADITWLVRDDAPHPLVDILCP